ncbi:hypothetical protein ARMSODRAFT_679932 [Armillaria solidipes]|uniref:Uncharacterized protein n=1 Tax=Armillaria solidipes TaxID=1076256 RepID=A0A2H3ATG1_9AGAR|nr:hypothetical protein ARMSODRAFT_679932 [Armillaria solidipes]
MWRLKALIRISSKTKHCSGWGGGIRRISEDSVLLHAIWCTTRLTPTDRRNARIWRIYLDEGAKMDTETLTGVHNTTDVLLALTGRFLQYCVVQTSQNIQADYNQVSMPVLCKSSRLLLEWFTTHRPTLTYHLTR